MNVPDSSVWIEYFREGPLASIFAPILEDLQRLIVPSIVIYEVHKWMLLKFGEKGAMNARLMMTRGKVMLLDPETAIAASRFQLSINSQWPMPSSMQRRSPMPPKSGRPMAISKDCQTCGSSKKIEASKSCCIFVVANGVKS
jgi:hypothetical protein